MLAGAWKLPKSKEPSGKDLSVAMRYSTAVRNQCYGRVKRETVIMYQMRCFQKREIWVDKCLQDFI